MEKETVVKVAISLSAVALLVARLLLPELKVDAISIGLLLICLLPWASAFIKTLKAPGGWEVELHKLDSKVQKVIDASSEDEADSSQSSDSSSSALSSEEFKLLDTLTKASVPLRSISGIAEDIKLDTSNVLQGLELLEEKGLATQVHGKLGIRWGVTPSGRKQLQSVKKI